MPPTSKELSITSPSKKRLSWNPNGRPQGNNFYYLPLILLKTNPLPSPSTYTHHLQYPPWNVETAFGSKRLIWPAVAVFCTPYNNAKCSVCELVPVGDYFHNFSTDADMCRPCMHAAVSAIKKCNLQVTERFLRQQKIKQFVPGRYCGFFHIHDGTNATIERDSRKVLRQKIRVENYLYRVNAKVEYWGKSSFIKLPASYAECERKICRILNVKLECSHPPKC